MTEQDLHEYNKWLTEIWSKQHTNIPFMIDAPKAFLKHRAEQLRIPNVVKSLPNKYCPQCGEPVKMKHKFWCSEKP